MMRTLKPKAINELIDKAGSDDDLVVAWEPSQDQPIRFTLVSVNDVLLTHDRVMPSSPVVFRRLPDPDTNGQYKVAWSLTAEVPIRRIALAIVNVETGNKSPVDGKQDMDRGDTWRDEATVDAP